MKKLIIAGLACSMLLATTPMAFAQCAVPPCGVPEPGQTILGEGNDGISGGVALVQKITNWLFTILLILAVLFIIMAAFKYLFSGGSEESVSSAHKMLIYAVVAIAVAFLAKGIVFVVQELVASGYSGGGGSGTGVHAGCSLQYVNGQLRYNCGASGGI